MTRIEIKNTRGERDGWFNLDTATYWEGERACYDGANRVNVHTRDQTRYQDLFRTSGGRWIINEVITYNGRFEHWTSISPDCA